MILCSYLFFFIEAWKLVTLGDCDHLDALVEDLVIFLGGATARKLQEVFMDLKTHHVEVANMYSLVENSLTESW